MVTQRQLFKMLFVLINVSACPAFALAVPQDLHFIGRYDFTWGNMPLAAVELSIDEDTRQYAVRLAVASGGIVNLFTRHRSDTSVTGDRRGDGYFPRHYESRYWTKDKPRHLKLVFDAKGVITEEIVEPPEDRAERPVVPHALKDGSLDPLTVILSVGAGHEKPRAFDAKRLYDGTAVKGEVETLNTYTGPRAAFAYTLTRVPIAGLTQKEIKQFGHGEPPLTFYFSADDNRIPLFASMPLYLGHLQGTLAQECRTWDECKVLAK